LIDKHDALNQVEKQIHSLITNGPVLQTFHQVEGMRSPNPNNNDSVGSISSAETKDCEIMFNS